MKEYLPLVCWLCISSGDGLLLWLLGAVFYPTLLDMALLKTVEVQTEYLDYFTRNINPLVRARYVWLATLTRQGRELRSYPGIERLLTFGLLNSYFFWWRFAPVTVERVYLPNLVGDSTVENSWGANWIPRLFHKEYTILWFEFYLCDLLHQREAPFRGLHISKLWSFSYILVHSRPVIFTSRAIIM